MDVIVIMVEVVVVVMVMVMVMVVAVAVVVSAGTEAGGGGLNEYNADKGHSALLLWSVRLPLLAACFVRIWKKVILRWRPRLTVSREYL